MKVLVQQWWMVWMSHLGQCLCRLPVSLILNLLVSNPRCSIYTLWRSPKSSHLIMWWLWQSLDYLGKPWQRGHLLFYAHVLSLLGPTSHQECVSRGTFFGLHGFPPEARELCCESSTGLVMNARHHFSHQAYFLCYSIHHIPWPEWQDCLHHCQDLL